MRVTEREPDLVYQERRVAESNGALVAVFIVAAAVLVGLVIWLTSHDTYRQTPTTIFGTPEPLTPPVTQPPVTQTVPVPYPVAVPQPYPVPTPSAGPSPRIIIEDKRPAPAAPSTDSGSGSTTSPGSSDSENMVPVTP